MSSKVISNKSSAMSSLLVASVALFFVAIVVQAQYNTYDSDGNSDSDGNPILTQAELGKLVRNTAKLQAAQSRNNQHQQQLTAATRNLYNRQQPLQYAPSHNKRSNSFGSQADLAGYGPVMGAATQGRRSSANNDQNDDDEGSSAGSSYGPGFGSSFDSANNGDSDNEGSNNENQPMNLNQAASGYPGQGDYNEAGLAGFGQSGFNEGADFNQGGEEYGLDARRAKSASSPLGSRGFGSDDDAGAPQYGPNSAVNSGGDDDEGRSAFAGEGGSENNDDDE